MFLKIIIFLNLTSIILARKFLALKEHDSCLLQNGGDGTCRFLGNCKPAESLLKESKQPEICRYIQPKSTPLYCCSNEDNSHRYGRLAEFFSNTFHGLIPGKNLQCNYKGDIPFHCCNNDVMDVKEQCEDDDCPPLPTNNPTRYGNMTDFIISKCLKNQEYIRKCWKKQMVQTRIDTCAMPKISGRLATRILGGEESVEGEFPHLALLGHRVPTAKNNVVWVGGGSLISEKFILTAAHVLIYETYGLVAYAWLGMRDVNDQSQGILYNIVKVIPHKYYSIKNESVHDIALLELDRKVLFSSVGHFIRPICLPFPGIKLHPERIIAGWGATRNNGPSHDVSLKAPVDILDYETECKHLMDKDLTWVPNNMICAFGKEKQDACKGDSGGPLMAVAQDLHCTYILEGIVASGNSCGETPGVYTNVAAYLDWIIDIVWPDRKFSSDCVRLD